MDIILRNFINLLRCGAFGYRFHAEPMSTFKWQKLCQMAIKQDVAKDVSGGMNMATNDERRHLGISLSSLTTLSSPALPAGKRDGGQAPPSTREEERFTDILSLSNRVLNKRLNNILEREKNDEDAQPETEMLLGIVIYNVRCMLGSGLSIRGIVELGKFLRTKGNRVDFIKIENWLRLLHLRRIAQLQGSILIDDFNFRKEEIPFVGRIEKGGHRLLLKTISRVENDTLEEWHFQEMESGFVRNNSRLMKRNLKRTVKYFKYAAVETTSTFASNLLKGLSEIEE